MSETPPPNELLTFNGVTYHFPWSEMKAKQSVFFPVYAPPAEFEAAIRRATKSSEGTSWKPIIVRVKEDGILGYRVWKVI